MDQNAKGVPFADFLSKIINYLIFYFWAPSLKCSPSLNGPPPRYRLTEISNTVRVRATQKKCESYPQTFNSNSKTHSSEPSWRQEAKTEKTRREREEIFSENKTTETHPATASRNGSYSNSQSHFRIRSVYGLRIQSHVIVVWSLVGFSTVQDPKLDVKKWSKCRANEVKREIATMYKELANKRSPTPIVKHEVSKPVWLFRCNLLLCYNRFYIIIITMTCQFFWKWNASDYPSTLFQMRLKEKRVRKWIIQEILKSGFQFS